MAFNIGRIGKEDEALMRWPPRSPDLTPYDFCLWGFVKDTFFLPPGVTGVGRSVFIKFVYHLRQTASNPQPDKAGSFILLYAVTISSFSQTSFNDHNLHLQPEEKVSQTKTLKT